MATVVPGMGKPHPTKVIASFDSGKISRTWFRVNEFLSTVKKRGPWRPETTSVDSANPNAGKKVSQRKPQTPKVSENRTSVSLRIGSAAFTAVTQLVRSSSAISSWRILRTHRSYVKLGPALWVPFFWDI